MSSEGRAVQGMEARRNEILDHVAVLKQLAAARPYMDMLRVGVFGGSFGGYFTIRAMFQAPEVFHVGVAIAPISDFRQVSGSPMLLLGSQEDDRMPTSLRRTSGSQTT